MLNYHGCGYLCFVGIAHITMVTLTFALPQQVLAHRLNFSALCFQMTGAYHHQKCATELEIAHSLALMKVFAVSCAPTDTAAVMHAHINYAYHHRRT